MKTLNYKTNLCVVGGGIAGICTAISAARHGIKVVLIQDRAVLGGNASSEIRMWICGADGKDKRETGIVEELMLENFHNNPSFKYSLWDLTLYSKVIEEENITLLLNSSVLDAVTVDGEIKSVKAWQSNAETFHIVEADYFADCSGDSILAPLTGAEYRYGREAKSEFGESISPEISDKKTMGMSCLFQIRETENKTTFISPKWANKYESDADLPYKDHVIGENYWWIELGGEWDCIHDTDRCRDELIKIALGVWDHMKNYGDHGVDNWELEWVGFLPGKRESRRYVGEYIVTENDVKSQGKFLDLVAYAGWSMDDHFPEGFNYTKGYPTIFFPAPSPWGLPLRCMISKNIKNLTFAGRNISVTHAALSSSRVMATCGILGQALGTAISQAVNSGTDIRNINIEKLQNTLMEDDCYLPWHERKVSNVSLCGEISHEVLRNGIDRGEENCLVTDGSEKIEYTFEKKTKIREIRLVFDSDLNRTYHNMPCCYPLEQSEAHKIDRVALYDCKYPETLIKAYDIIGIKENGEELVLTVDENYQRFVKLTVDWDVKTVRFIPKSTHGAKEFRLFSFELA